MAVITKDAGVSRANLELVSGEVTALSFAKSYEYYAVRNDGENDFYISTEDSACTPNGDNVVCVKASDSYVHHNGLGKEGNVYFSGNGAVTVIGQDTGENPFKTSWKGGGKGVVNFNNMPVKSGLRVAFDCNTVYDDLSVWKNSIKGRPPMTLQNANKCYDGSVVFETGNDIYGSSACGVCVDDETISDFTVYLISKVEYGGSSNPYFFDMALNNSDKLAFARSGSTLCFWVKDGTKYSTSAKIFNGYGILAVTQLNGATTVYFNGDKVETVSLSADNYNTYGIPYFTALDRNYIYDVSVKCIVVAKGAHSEDEISRNTRWLNEQYKINSIFVADDICLPNSIYEQGEVWSDTPADNVSVVDLSTPVTFGDYTANSAVKIYGAGNNSITYGWNFTINVPENDEKEYSLLIGVSAEGNTCDLAYVEVNGAQIGSYTTTSGTLTKHSIPLNLSEGQNTVTVKYKKDSSSSKGDDCVYIYGYGIGHYEF